ncbi:MAG TPA: FkbM family methyltransferase [Verrucomicrobiae bacterium]|nr:FkbM family methyltransferase [Verrucomicrobiae bacterium]
MPGEFLVNVQGGGQVCVARDLSNMTTFVLLEQETWFEEELGFVRACVAEGEAAVDVGANVGVFSIALAASVGATGKLLAVEPAAATAAMLRRTLKDGAMPQARVLQAALSDRAGRATLEIGDSPELSALTEAPADGRRTEAVELQRLDDAAAGLGSVTFVKIDAEGHEVSVARGGERLLRRDEPLVMFEVRQGAGFDYSLLDYLGSLGYRGYQLVPGLGVLAPFDRTAPVDPSLLNLFACTPGRARALAREGLLSGAVGGGVPGTDLAPEAREYLDGLPGANRPALGNHARALELFAALQSATAEPGEELALLVDAHRLAALAFAEKPSLPRGLTHVRLSADLRLRTEAIATLATLLRCVEQPARLDLDEPCLPPVPRFAALDPGTDANHWLQSAVVESYLRLSSYSSAFQGGAAIPMLDYLRQRPYYCAEMERRRQLLRMIGGQQSGPEAHSLLTQAAPDNLNPWFWTGQWPER